MSKYKEPKIHLKTNSRVLCGHIPSYTSIFTEDKKTVTCITCKTKIDFEKGKPWPDEMCMNKTDSVNKKEAR